MRQNFNASQNASSCLQDSARRVGRKDQLRTLKVTNRSQCHCFVKHGKGLQPLLFRDRIELRKRFAHIADAHQRPCFDKTVDKWPNPLTLDILGQQFFELAGADQIRGHHKMRHLTVLAGGLHRFGDWQCAINTPKRQIGDQRIVHQFDVARIPCQCARKVVRGLLIVVVDGSGSRRKVGARHGLRGRRKCQRHAH